jgi:hypothetical protein
MVARVAPPPGRAIPPYITSDEASAVASMKASLAARPLPTAIRPPRPERISATDPAPSSVRRSVTSVLLLTAASPDSDLRR